MTGRVAVRHGELRRRERVRGARLSKPIHPWSRANRSTSYSFNRRGGHAKGHVRDTFLDALEAYDGWDGEQPEPTVEFEVRYEPGQISISAAAGRGLGSPHQAQPRRDRGGRSLAAAGVAPGLLRPALDLARLLVVGRRYGLGGPPLHAAAARASSIVKFSPIRSRRFRSASRGSDGVALGIPAETVGKASANWRRPR